MPFKDPEKKKAWQKPYQKEWMLRKLQERKQEGICRVSGCGESVCEKSAQYCEKHREQHNIEAKAYRKRRKEKDLKAT